MRVKRAATVLSAALVATLGLSACGGGSSSDSGPADASAKITVDGTEPQNPLVPSNTSEVGGGNVISMLFKGLVDLNEKGKPVNDLAKSISSKDNQNWTIKVKSGKKFTNGEKITAKSFVDTWNFAATAKNAQEGSYFFEPIAGYDKVAKNGAKSDKMSGLKVVDDNTFTVKLTSPQSDFPLRLGYSAFVPVPKSGLKDIKSFGENPVGYGPYKMAKKKGAWKHNSEINLTKNKSYDGPEQAKNGGITFKLYQNPDTAYQDLLANNLDVLETVPASDLANYKDDLGDRSSATPYAGNQTLAIPYYLKNWKGKAGKLRRIALSKAINRKQITKVIFKGAMKPASDFTAPVLQGYKSDLLGSDNTKFDAAEAKKLWAKAEKIKPYDKSEKLTFAYNTDKDDHKKWVDAVVNQVKNNLDIDVSGKPYATFKQLRTEADAGKLTGADRSGWQADYPSMYNFMGPVFAKGAASNDSRYDNPKFEKALQDGLAAKSTKAASAKFQQADSMLLEDMPAIPLWYEQQNVGWAEGISNVKVGWDGVPLYYNVTKSSDH